MFLCQLHGIKFDLSISVFSHIHRYIYGYTATNLQLTTGWWESILSVKALQSLQERLKALKKGYGKKELGTVTLDMAIGGMRGIPVRAIQKAVRKLQQWPTYNVAEHPFTQCRACYGRLPC